MQYNSWYPYHLSSFLTQPFNLLLISHRLYQIAQLFLFLCKQATCRMLFPHSYSSLHSFFHFFIKLPNSTILQVHLASLNFHIPSLSYTIHCPAPFACFSFPTNFTSHCKTCDNFPVIPANSLYHPFRCCSVSYRTFFVQLSYENKFFSN